MLTYLCRTLFIHWLLLKRNLIWPKILEYIQQYIKEKKFTRGQFGGPIQLSNGITQHGFRKDFMLLTGQWAQHLLNFLLAVTQNPLEVHKGDGVLHLLIAHSSKR